MISKRIASLLLTFALAVLLINSVNVSAETVTMSSEEISWSYIITNQAGEVVGTGIIPSEQLRYTWDGLTLNNGETAKFVPAHNPRGLYCLAGVTLKYNYSYSGSSNLIRVNIYREGSQDPVGNSGKIIGGGAGIIINLQYEDYYYGTITNYSSDPMTIKGFSINF